jgi:hypothetical protein
MRVFLTASLLVRPEMLTIALPPLAMPVPEFFFVVFAIPFLNDAPFWRFAPLRERSLIRLVVPFVTD